MPLLLAMVVMLCLKAKCISEPHVLYHGDELQVASHKFSLHIHPRQETCADCEPGCCTTTTPDPTTNTGQVHSRVVVVVVVVVFIFTHIRRLVLTVNLNVVPLLHLITQLTQVRVSHVSSSSSPPPPPPPPMM